MAGGGCGRETVKTPTVRMAAGRIIIHAPAGKALEERVLEAETELGASLVCVSLVARPLRWQGPKKKNGMMLTGAQKK